MTYLEDTINYAMKTAEQELVDVLDGSKPAALGFWEYIPVGILRYELHPIYGSYYKYAIAMDGEKLNELVRAYYMPYSADRDASVGRALGYSEISIKDYTSKIKYSKIRYGKKHKIISTIQRYGVFNTLLNAIVCLIGVKFIRHICVKEGLI